MMSKLDASLPLGYSSEEEVIGVAPGITGFVAGNRVECAGADTVRKLIDADREGKADNALLIWSILTREMWFHTFIDKSIDLKK